jgi:hypothetical protein
MNWKLISGWVSLLVLPIIGYRMTLVAATLETTLHQGFACPGQSAIAAQDFQVLAVRQWSHGAVAIYRGLCPPELKARPEGVLQTVLSYRLLQRHGREWQSGPSGSHVSRPGSANPLSTKSDPLIAYGSDRVATPTHDRYSIFYGQVLSPKVAAVEVTFDNGKILRDKVLDGMFALVAPGATGICDVRIFGADNQILQRDEWVSAQPHLPQIGNTCQPMSGEL